MPSTFVTITWLAALLLAAGPSSAKAQEIGAATKVVNRVMGWSMGYEIRERQAIKFREEINTLAGSATIAGTFALAFLVTGRTRAGVIAALTTLLGFTVYVQARIAMLDTFMTTFLIWGIVVLGWSMRRRGKGAWIVGAILVGLATACKWGAAPYVAFAAIAFVSRRSARAGSKFALGMQSISSAARSLGKRLGLARSPSSASAKISTGAGWPITSARSAPRSPAGVSAMNAVLCFPVVAMPSSWPFQRVR